MYNVLLLRCNLKRKLHDWRGVVLYFDTLLISKHNTTVFITDSVRIAVATDILYSTIVVGSFLRDNDVALAMISKL